MRDTEIAEFNDLLDKLDTTWLDDMESMVDLAYTLQKNVAYGYRKLAGEDRLYDQSIR